MRVFVGIELANELRWKIASFSAELARELPSAKWVPPENLHLTIRFVGEAEPGAVARLKADLHRSLASAEPFVLRFKGLGAFPNPRRSRVLWIGIEEPPPPFSDSRTPSRTPSNARASSPSPGRFILI